MLKKHKSMHREASQRKPSARAEMGAIEKIFRNLWGIKEQVSPF
jgi:hypothetical protein